MTTSPAKGNRASVISCRLALELLAAQGAAGALAGGFAARPDRTAIDKNMGDAGRRPGRLGKGGAVDDRVGVKDAEIGIGAGRDDAAPGKTKPRRRQSGHLVDCLL